MNNRPKWNDREVLSYAFDQFLDELNVWHAENDHTFSEQDVKRQFCNFRDGFDVCFYMVKYDGYAPNTKLVVLFQKMYDTAKLNVGQFVTKWVMETGTRFKPKKGNNVLISHGGKDFNAIVIDVLDIEARGWVEIVDTSEIVAVNSEDILKIVSHGDGRMKPTPVDPNGGGTPVAMVA